MARTLRLSAAVVLTLSVMVALASNVLAHAGEEHSDPFTAVLHQGNSAIAVTLIIIGLTGAAIRLYGSRPSVTRSTEPDR